MTRSSSCQRPRSTRRGFALVLVLVLATLILGAWGVAARHVATTLRIEQARANRARREATRAPALSALAAASAALEVGYPPTTPYQASVVAGDGTWFVARFTRDPADPLTWDVAVAPDDGTTPPLDLARFGPSPP